MCRARFSFPSVSSAHSSKVADHPLGTKHGTSKESALCVKLTASGEVSRYAPALRTHLASLRTSRNPIRRFRIWISPSILIRTGIAIIGAIAAAWGRCVRVAPHSTRPQIDPTTFTGPHGFPVWVRYSHFFNFFFVMILIRSGLSIW